MLFGYPGTHIPGRQSSEIKFPEGYKTLSQAGNIWVHNPSGFRWDIIFFLRARIQYHKRPRERIEKMKALFVKWPAMVFVCFLSASFAWAENKTIVTEGMSTVSYDAAVRDAQRSAVEQGAGTFVQSETEIKNFEVQKDEIFTHTEGFIAGFEILEKSKKDDFYTVKIKSEISLDKVKDRLIAMKILLESLEKPKLMVLIDEDYSGLEIEGMRLAETEMISLLQKKGFEIVDKAQVEAANQMGQSKQALAGNENAAKALGMMFGAQYVVLGKATVHKSDVVIADTGFKTMSASLQAKIMHSQSGSILGAVVEKGKTAHISELEGAAKALQKAAEKAVDGYIADAILASFQDFLNNGLPLKVNVVGVTSFSEYKQVIRFLEEMSKVASCKKEGWNKAGGLLVLNLRYKGTSEELAEATDQKDVGGAKLSVEDFAPEKLDLSLK